MNIHFGQFQDSAYEMIQFLDIFTNIIQVSFIISNIRFFQFFPEYLFGNPDPGKRRAKLMGDIRRQLPCVHNHGLQFIGHSIEGLGQLADFILAADIRSMGKIAFRNGQSRLAKFFEPTGDDPRNGNE